MFEATTAANAGVNLTKASNTDTVNVPWQFACLRFTKCTYIGTFFGVACNLCPAVFSINFASVSLKNHLPPRIL